MRKRRTWFAVSLIMILLCDNPLIVRADLCANRFVSLYHPFFLEEELPSKREQKDVYGITYHLNGGKESLLTRYAYSGKDLPMRLSIPEKAGYNFAGWYLESSYRHKISVIEDCEYGDMTLYAKWTKCIDSDYNVQMYSYNTSAVKSARDKKLKDCSYGFVNHIEIPGMPSTREQDYVKKLISTYGQCPQGICLTEDYCLITSYSSDDKNCLGSLYVFDKKTGEYLVTLGMKKRSHLGGLTCDGTNVWICHSNSWSLERISYDYIRKMAERKPKAFVDSTGLFEEYKVANAPSCVSSYDGKLWVATHNSLFKSIMISYEYRDDKLQVIDSYRIPKKVQGIAFDSGGRIYLSTSYGRAQSSYLKVYGSADALNQSPERPQMKVEMPPCSEEIFLTDNILYILFESASLKYFEGTDGRGRSIAPIDKILAIDVASVI